MKFAGNSFGNVLISSSPPFIALKVFRIPTWKKIMERWNELAQIQIFSSCEGNQVWTDGSESEQFDVVEKVLNHFHEKNSAESDSNQQFSLHDRLKTIDDIFTESRFALMTFIVGQTFQVWSSKLNFCKWKSDWLKVADYNHLPALNLTHLMQRKISFFFHFLFE